MSDEFVCLMGNFFFLFIYSSLFLHLFFIFSRSLLLLFTPLFSCALQLWLRTSLSLSLSLSVLSCSFFFLLSLFHFYFPFFFSFPSCFFFALLPPAAVAMSVAEAKYLQLLSKYPSCKQQKTFSMPLSASLPPVSSPRCFEILLISFLPWKYRKR